MIIPNQAEHDLLLATLQRFVADDAQIASSTSIPLQGGMSGSAVARHTIEYTAHLVRTSGFAGVHPRKRSLMLNLRIDHPLTSPRVARVEQVSKNRYHNEVKLERPEDVDAELIGWLREAYALGA